MASQSITTQCCVTGGGPAGMMLGFLLARAGIDVVVLEKHADFLRDFRGDTVHPSTMTVMDELGLLDDGFGSCLGSRGHLVGEQGRALLDDAEQQPAEERRERQPGGNPDRLEQVVPAGRGLAQTERFGQPVLQNRLPGRRDGVDALLVRTGVGARDRDDLQHRSNLGGPALFLRPAAQLARRSLG